MPSCLAEKETFHNEKKNILLMFLVHRGMSRGVRDPLLVSALSLKINKLKPGKKLKDEERPMTKVCSYPGPVFPLLS